MNPWNHRYRQFKTVPTVEPASHQAVLTKARKNKLFFAREFLAHHITVEFGIHHQEWLTDDNLLQAIAAPRGSAKTTFFSLIEPLHAICFQTETFIIIISETASLATERVMDIKSEIEGNDKIQAAFGDLIGTIWKQDDIVCSNGVRVLAKGRSGQIRGSKHRAERPSLIILDDVESSELVLSPLNRDKVRQWYLTDVRRAGRPDNTTKFKIIGTYLHEDALLPNLVENVAYHGKKYQAVLSWSTRPDLWDNWKSIYTDLTNPNRGADSRCYYETHKAEMLNGVDMLWPAGLDYYTVQEAIISDGKYAVMKEFQNEPFDPERTLFPMQDAMGFTVERAGLLRDDQRLVKWDDITGISAFLDWAGGKDRKQNAFAAIVCVAWETFPHTNEVYGYVLDAWLDRVAPSKQLARLFDFFEEYSRLYFRAAIEAADINRTIDKELRDAFEAEKEIRRVAGRPYNLHLETVYQRQEKFTRISKMEPKIANGWLCFNKWLPEEFQAQMRQFPTHEFVDGPDALEGATQMAITRKPARRDSRSNERKPFTFEF